MDGRISSVDLKCVGAVYHRACWIKFKKGKTFTTPGRAPSDDISQAMEIIYDFMEESEDSQFSIKKLLNLVAMKYTISEMTIRRKLSEHYGNRIVLASTKKKISVVCFRTHGAKIINDRWYEEKMKDEEQEEIRVMIKAADIVRRHIESHPG